MTRERSERSNHGHLFWFGLWLCNLKKIREGPPAEASPRTKHDQGPNARYGCRSWCVQEQAAWNQGIWIVCFDRWAVKRFELPRSSPRSLIQWD